MSKLVQKILKLGLVLSLMVMTSCILEDHYGYPKRVEFSAEGGSKTITGEVTFDDLTIYDNDGNRVSFKYECADTNAIFSDFTVSGEWLTVRSYNQSLILYAEPNTSGKKRELLLSADYWNTYADIVIKQKK